MSWDPTRYLNFAGHRMRPALDLMQRIAHGAPKYVVDLGCGPGNVTAMLRERWPQAELLGVDNSREMLGKARRDFPAGAWSEGDIASWTASRPVDVMFSNAALHWVPDHARLLPRLLSQLAAQGVLAVQMPNNHRAPSHMLLREVAAQERWAARMKDVREGHTLSAEAYFDIISPHCKAADIWETEYLQVLEGDDPILEWTKGTSVLPYRAALDEADWPAFEAAYRGALRAAYPPRADGKTLFPFRRLFMVAAV